MKNYDRLWGAAEDNYGIVTSAQACEMGVSRQSLVAMERGGLLTRIGHGVYQVKHHVPGPNDAYAAAIAIVGEDAYLRGESVLAMHGLVASNPAVMHVGSPVRVRRRFPHGLKVKDRTPCSVCEYDGFEGIRCQRMAEAISTAYEEGMLDADRVSAAASAAKEKGLLIDEESAKFQNQP